MLGSWKIYLLLGAAVVAFGTGWTTRDWKCDADYWRKEAQLQTARAQHAEDNLKRIAAVTDADAEALIRDEGEIEKLEKKIRDQKDQITAGVCFDAWDTERVRSLWE